MCFPSKRQKFGYKSLHQLIQLYLTLFVNDLAEATLCNPPNPLSPRLLRQVLIAGDQPMDVLSL